MWAIKLQQCLFQKAVFAFNVGHCQIILHKNGTIVRNLKCKVNVIIHFITSVFSFTRHIFNHKCSIKNENTLKYPDVVTLEEIKGT